MPRMTSHIASAEPRVSPSASLWDTISTRWLSWTRLRIWADSGLIDLLLDLLVAFLLVDLLDHLGDVDGVLGVAVVDELQVGDPAQGAHLSRQLVPDVAPRVLQRGHCLSPLGVVAECADVDLGAAKVRREVDPDNADQADPRIAEAASENRADLIAQLRRHLVCSNRHLNLRSLQRGPRGFPARV